MTVTQIRTSMQVEHLSVELGRKHIVREVSFSVEPGQWLTIIGPNGAGKTTLLKSIAGITKHSGSISVGDVSLEDISHRDRACWVAYVPQSPVFPNGMSVVDYVMLGRTAHLNMLATERAFDIDFTYQVLQELHLMEFAGRDVASLSGGERQRVSIARALAQASPIILLDEPTSALDIGMQQEVLTMIDGLRRERQLCIISTMHDLTLSGKYPDQLLLMSDGQVQVSGSPDAVLTESNIAQFYGANVRIIQENGRNIVIPQ